MAKPKWPKVARLLVPLFECAHIYLCTTRAEFSQVLKVMNLPEESVEKLGGCVRLYANNKAGETLMIIGVFTGQLHVLAHECAHAAFRICEISGVAIDPQGNNETFCYLLDNIFKAFEPHITKPAT